MEYNTITLLLAALIGLVIGVIVGILLRKKLVEGNQRNIALQGRQIIENSISEAEQIKKEALLQAKEEALLIKQEADRELKANRLEIKEDQRRLNRKFDEIQREFQILEEKQASLKYRE
ncbi:MAG: Rnase Y domain-containing protein, partial [Desulfobulbus sp.]|nr:Rnase Y domain-containing protein [Desulfobulbus sp.]